MSKTLVSLEIQGPHATIEFSTPDDGVNVMSPDVIHSFGATVARVKKEPQIRTTAITAEGKVFLAGADVKTVSSFGPEEARAYCEMGNNIMRDLESLPSITIAAINGPALGPGLEIALACDFRVGVKWAKLGQPEVTLGLIPGWGGIMRLIRLVGPARAKRLILSGAQISAEDCLAFGLVDETVNSVEDLRHRVLAFCRSFRLAAPTAVALAKRAARDHDEITAFVECFNNREAREGLAAFIEKRPASWMEV
jgi:enoyl-CoA hydratase